MIRGEISNESPPVWLLTLDAALGAPLPERTVPKKWFRAASAREWVDVIDDVEFAPLVLAALWRRRDQIGFTLDMVAWGDVPPATLLYDRLEQLGGHCVRQVVNYRSEKAFREHLKYRPDVVRIIDIPARRLYWGNRGVTLEDIR